MFFNYEGGTYSLFILAILCTPSWSETNKHTSFLKGESGNSNDHW